MTSREIRAKSYAQTSDLNLVERFGVWLSKRQIQHTVGNLAGKDVADIGCGYQAETMRRYLDSVGSALLVDLSLADDLKVHPKVTAIEGDLPGVLTELPARSLDVILCMAVLEHLWEPERTLAELRRLLRPGGVCAINVPSWAGKPVLEYVGLQARLGGLGRGDGRPQDVLRPPGLVAAAGAGRLPPQPHSRVQAQVSLRHIRGLPRRRGVVEP